MEGFTPSKTASTKRSQVTDICCRHCPKNLELSRTHSLTMDITDVTPHLDQLEDELNKAQEALRPLLGDIGDISAKLPLLDKAKLYVLVSYTIESLLFCEPYSSLLCHLSRLPCSHMTQRHCA